MKTQLINHYSQLIIERVQKEMIDNESENGSIEYEIANYQFNIDFTGSIKTNYSTELSESSTIKEYINSIDVTCVWGQDDRLLTNVRKALDNEIYRLILKM